MDREMTGNLLGCIGLLAIGLVISVLMPLAYAVGGYFTGWILSSVFTFAGQWVITGAQSIGIELTLASLPPLGAFLAFVGAFFKSHQSNTNKTK